MPTHWTPRGLSSEIQKQVEDARNGKKGNDACLLIPCRKQQVAKDLIAGKAKAAKKKIDFGRETCMTAARSLGPPLKAALGLRRDVVDSVSLSS